MDFKTLVQWSKTQFHYLPWRQNRSLYKTLVSEIMLQQTTVSTVMNHFERFIREYPSFKDLAQATEQQLLMSWKGLGYYRRAKNLKKACEFIVQKFDGEIPLHYETLIKIPGIGDYTANALMAIGADINALALDANLERVIARLFALQEEKGPKLIKKIKEINALTNELQQFGARSVNEALMDLGRQWCQARKTSCDLCPLRLRCQAFKAGQVLSYPVIKEIKKETHSMTLLRIILEKDNQYLVYKKKDNEWLSGQYEVPTFVLSTSDEKLKQYPPMTGDFHLLPEFKTGITKYDIINKVLWVNEKEFTQLGLALEDFEWGNKNLSTASIKAIQL